MKVHIISALYADKPGESGVYASAGKNSDTERFQAQYWRTLVVSHVSISSIDPDLQLHLATNVLALPIVDGIKVEEVLRKCGTSVSNPEFTWAPPLEFGRAWRATFYKFDALRSILASDLSSSDIVVLLDSDVVLTKPLAEYLREVESCGVMGLKMEYTEDHRINGCSRRELTSISSSLNYKHDRVIDAFGAEFLAVRGDVLADLLEVLSVEWQKNLELWRTGQPHFKTEEHLMSHVFSDGRFTVANATGVVKRMSTYNSYFNVTPSDLSLPLWHLPAEKHFGFRSAFRSLRRDGRWRLPEGEHVAFLAKKFELPNKTKFRAFKRTARHLANKIVGRF